MGRKVHSMQCVQHLRMAISSDVIGVIFIQSLWRWWCNVSGNNLHESEAASAPWVTLEESTLKSIATSGYLCRKRGTGHKRATDAFPAAQSATEPGNGRMGSSAGRLGSGTGLNFATAPRTVTPMSKHWPVLDRCPLCQIQTQTTVYTH